MLPRLPMLYIASAAASHPAGPEAIQPRRFCPVKGDNREAARERP